MKERLGVWAAMKKLIQLPFLMFVLIFISSCSSNNVGQDDLSISEIEDIERTGEFSAEDFFSDEDVLADSGVSVDLEGVDSDLDIGDDMELLSDVDFDDFEGENFDDSSDFETDFADSTSSEFDEFDEFMTDESVAQNEEFDFGDETAVAGGSDDFGFDEDDVFAEFDQVEPSMDSGNIAADDFDFESAFEDDMQAQEEIATSNDSFSDDFGSDFGDDLFSETESQNEIIANTGGTPVDSAEPTASQILGSKSYTGVGQGQSDTGSEQAAVKQLVPVQKMAGAPFNRAGILLNTLYIVRAGDTINSIKDKIYGPGSSANLTSINPTLKPNNLRVGEKVYYNSPNRPNDNGRMMTFYDDVGMSPQYYQISQGQSIRKVSEDLLGHPRSWMEVWATNPEVESKWTVSKAHNLRYFPEGGAAPVLAQQQPELIEAVEEPTSITTNMGGGMQAEPDFDSQFDDNFTEDMQIATNDNSANNMGGAAEPDFDQGFGGDMGGGFDQGFNDQANSGQGDFDQGFNDGFDDGFDDGMDTAMNNQDAAAQAIPDNFKNAGTKGLSGPFGLDKKLFDSILLGGGGAILLLGLFLFARRRRAKSEASVQDFDFGGNTQIDEQTKTHIDI